RALAAISLSVYVSCTTDPSPLFLVSSLFVFFSMIPRPPRPTLFPYTTLFRSSGRAASAGRDSTAAGGASAQRAGHADPSSRADRSEEHTSELQSRRDLVCRLLLEKKKKTLLARLTYAAQPGRMASVLLVPVLA